MIQPRMNTERRSRNRIVLVLVLVIEPRHPIEDEGENEDDEEKFARRAKILRDSKYEVVIVDASGKTVADFRFEHTANGWADFLQQITAFPDLALAVETKCGAAVEKLMDLQCSIFPVHPQSAKAYRQRKVPSGNKTDRVDAWSWPTPFVSTARSGSNLRRRIRGSKNCSCCTATRSG